ncbi:hypothetical protein BC332_20987 [Capsicum chinense]|nr:hypothetical protein BC332_20987 [Capsicum chinense]
MSKVSTIAFKTPNKVWSVRRDVIFDESSILDPRKFSLELLGNENYEQVELPVSGGAYQAAFIHGALEETIYRYHPKGFLAEVNVDHVCQLKKSLYGLKQFPRQWFNRLDAFMTTHGFSRSAFGIYVYHKKMPGNSMIYLLMYVDDMLIVANIITEINALKKLLSKEFDMMDLGAVKKILGMEISRGDGVVHLSRKRYIEKVLENQFAYEQAFSAFIRIDDLTFSPFNFITNTTLGVHYAKDISALSGINQILPRLAKARERKGRDLDQLLIPFSIVHRKCRDNGQVSGRVLVYRNPGLHFGDVHVMKARYVEELVDIVGDAKYGIFCFTKGPRSAATEIANGDFDGDISSRFSELLSGRKGAYLLLNPTLSGIQKWVFFYGLGDHEISNPGHGGGAHVESHIGVACGRCNLLVDSYTTSKPWTRMHSTPKAVSKKPSEFSVDELEYELFRQFLEAKAEGYAYKFTYIILSNALTGKGMGFDVQRADIFSRYILWDWRNYLADSWLAFMDRLLMLRGDDVDGMHSLKGKMPHLIDIYYDALDAPKSGKKRSINCLALRLKALQRVTRAMNSGSEHRITSCNEVIKKYKKLLYGAVEFEQTVRKTDIFNEALAIYHVTYDHARTTYNIEKCGFAWKVAGSELCRIHDADIEAKE